MFSLVATALLLVQGPISVTATDRVLNPHQLPGPGSYEALVPDDHSVWIVRAHDISIDLTNRRLRPPAGATRGQDASTGAGILLDGCINVTLKNADVAGFRFNIVLRDCNQVTLIGCKANRSRAIRSGSDGKPVDTFLNLRDFQAWKSYGAGVWMDRCKACEIKNCSASQAQNGMVLNECSHCNLVDNDCSTNGGWGFALWHSDRNTLAWNHADFCNRPWGGGWGGDSAGIVAINTCIANQFISNSLTHCGDGFFLTDKLNGGFDTSTQKYTLNSGSDMNYIAYNDGSWSSNNAFEGTFSQSNTYYSNLAEDSNYGFWLGFSNYSFLINNEILNNRTDGVAIGQGANSTIYHNLIFGNKEVGVHIWSDPGPAETARPSTNNRILENQIKDSRLAISFSRSYSTEVLGNTVERAGLPPDVKLGTPKFIEALRLSNWRNSSAAKRIDGWLKLKPKNWQFYRDTDGPKGPSALKIGDFAPDRR